MLVHMVNQPLGPGSSVGAAVTLEWSYLQSHRKLFKSLCLYGAPLEFRDAGRKSECAM